MLWESFLVIDISLDSFLFFYSPEENLPYGLLLADALRLGIKNFLESALASEGWLSSGVRRGLVPTNAA